MHTITGCREFPKLPLVLFKKLTIPRRFFPSTEPEPESDWEEVEGGESAENGPVTKDGDAKEAEEEVVILPDAPTGEPMKPEEPTPKKQKPNDEEKL